MKFFSPSSTSTLVKSDKITFLDVARAKALDHQSKLRKSLEHRFKNVVENLYPALDGDVELLLGHFDFFISLAKTQYLRADDGNGGQVQDEYHQKCIQKAREDQQFYSENSQLIDKLSTGEQQDYKDEFLKLCQKFIAHCDNNHTKYAEISGKLTQIDKSAVKKCFSAIIASKEKLMADFESINQKIMAVSTWEGVEKSYYPLRFNKLSQNLLLVFDNEKGPFSCDSQQHSDDEIDFPGLLTFQFSMGDYNDIFKKALSLLEKHKGCIDDRVAKFKDFICQKLTECNQLPCGFSKYKMDDVIYDEWTKNESFYGTYKVRSFSMFLFLLENQLGLKAHLATVDEFETASICKWDLPEEMCSWLDGFQAEKPVLFWKKKMPHGR